MNTLAKLLVYALLIAGVILIANGTAKHHYQKPLLDKLEKLEASQKEANSKAKVIVQIKKVQGETVYIDRIKEVKIYAENLPKDAACLADAEFVRLHRTASR